MTLELKELESFEAQDFEERAGMISIYLCTGCGKLILYSYIASGITPLKLTCVECGGIAMAEDKTNVMQPDRVWYRPKNLKALEKLAWAAYHSGLKEGHYRDSCPIDVVASILVNFVEHYNGGGLFARTLNEWIKT